MATTYNILGILCIALAVQPVKSAGYFLDKLSVEQGSPSLLKRDVHPLARTPATAPTKIIVTAKGQLGVKELTGNNDGKQVEAYLAYVNLPKGHPWCAAFVSWVYGQAGFALPKTAWSPALFPTARVITDAEPAAVFGIYFPRLKRIAHVGLVEQIEGSWIITIEGNTNTTGSRDGDGVYRKRRLKKSIKSFARWIPTEKGGIR